MDLWPNYAFTPDGKSLVFSNNGQARAPRRRERRAIADIPFTAAVEQFVAPRVTWQEKVESGPVKARILRWPSQSADGRYDRVRGLRPRLAAGDRRRQGRRRARAA